MEPVDRSRYAIHAAARDGQINLVESLLNSNAKLATRVDEDDRLPLHWATSSSHQPIIDLLSHLPSFDPDVQDGAGWTPLMIASSIPSSSIAASGSLANTTTTTNTTSSTADPDTMATFFLSRGADPNIASNSGQTALHFAASKGKTDTVRALLSAGARSFIKDARGQRALHRAAAVGAEGVVKCLVQGTGRALLVGEDADGFSPLHHAIAEGHGETAMILLRAGARLKRKEDGDPLMGMDPDVKAVEYITRKAEEEGITITEDP